MSRSLDDLATIQSGVTLARDEEKRLITITGGLLEVNTWLDTDSIAPGWRILCKDSGGISFNAPDFPSTGISISPAANFAGRLSFAVADFDRVQAGDPFTISNLGGYTGPNTTDTYYAGKLESSPGSGMFITAYKTKATALSNSSNTDDYVLFTGSGTVSDVVLDFASRTGRLDIGSIGSDDEAEIHIIEDETAHKFGGDNYANNTDTSRFQSGKVSLTNVFWAVDTNQSGTRSDFDIYMGDSTGASMPEVTLKNCKIVTDTRFNHFGSNQLTIDGLDFFNTNTDAPTGAELEFVLPPASIDNLNLKHANKGFRVLPFSQPNDTPIVLRNVTGGTKIGMISHVPTGRSSQNVGATQSKFVHTIDLAGEVTRVANERIGNVRDFRTVNFQFDDVAPSLIADQEIKIKATSSGFPTVAITNPLTLTIDSSGQATGVLLYKNFGHNSATGAHNNTYQLTVNTPNTRRYQTTFTVDGSDTGAPQLKAFALTADLLPDGTKPHTIQPPTECTTLTQIHRAVKVWEADNYDVDPKGNPICFVYADELRFRSGYSVVLSSTATDLIAISGTAITIKCGATLAASNGLKAIKTSGVGTTISVTGTVDTSAVWLRDSNGQESKISITNNMGEDVTFSVVKKSDGTKPASSLTIDDGSVGTINISTKGLGSGYNVVGKRKGYHAFVYEVDLSAGGEFNITAISGRQIKQPTGAASYPGSEVVTTGISISDESDGATPGMHVAIGNTTYTADQIFKRFEDYLATSYGGRYLGLGGDQMIYTSDTIKGDQLYLGSHIKVKRSDSEHANATIRASLFADDRAPIDNVNGDIMTVEGLDLPALAKTIITGTDFDTEETGTQSIWGKLLDIETAVDGNSTSLSALGNAEGNSDNTEVLEKIAENKTAIGEVKDVVDGHTTDITTIKTTVEAIDTQTETNETKIGEVKTAVGIVDTVVDRINTKVSNNTTSMTTLTALVNNMPTSVWDHIIDDTLREDLVGFSPSSIGSQGNSLYIKPAHRPLLNTGDELIITDLGGYTGLDLNRSYYIKKSEDDDFFVLFEDKNAAETAEGFSESVVFTNEGGSGRAENIRLTAKNVVKIGDGNYLVKQVHDTVKADVGGNANLASLLATLTTNVSNVPGEVWAETTDGSFTYKNNIIGMYNKITQIDNKVDDLPDQIDAVHANVWRYPQSINLYSTTISFFVYISSSEHYYAWRVNGWPTGKGIQTGDKVKLTNNGNSSSPNPNLANGVRLNTTYHIRLTSDGFTLHETENKAITNETPLEYAKEIVAFNPADPLTITFEERGTYDLTDGDNMHAAVMEAHDILDDDEYGLGTVKGSLESLATAVSDVPTEVWGSDLDPDLAGTQDIRTAIQKINSLMGANFVESDVNLQLALRLILAVLVGKLVVTNEGGTFKFHRLDTGETAAVSANADEMGRTSIRFGNNIDA